MFKSLFRPKTFGLDISKKLIRVFQLPNKSATVGIKQGIQAALKKAHIKSKYAVISIPEDKSFIRLVKKDGNIKKEIQKHIPLPIDKVYYDYQETPEGLFISATDKKTIDKYLRLAKKERITAQVLEPESIAITRALIHQNGDFMIINANQDQTDFIIVSNRVICLTASRPAPDIQQIKKYLKFYKINKIILCGDSDLKKLIESLNSLELPIQIAKEPIYATAIGLASRNND